MRKGLFFLCGVVCAQMTALTASELPKIGLQYRYHTLIDTANFPLQPGPNQVWDLTSRNFQASNDTLGWLTPQGWEGYDSFPQSNFAQKGFLLLGIFNIPQNLFGIMDSNALVYQGFWQYPADFRLWVQGLYFEAQAVQYDRPDTFWVSNLSYGAIRQFPTITMRLHIGTAPEDSFIIRHMNRSITIDAYGSMYFYGYTYPEVVRLRMDTYIVDTAFAWDAANNQWDMPYFLWDTLTQYYWFAKDVGVVFEYQIERGVSITTLLTPGQTDTLRGNRSFGAFYEYLNLNSSAQDAIDHPIQVFYRRGNLIVWNAQGYYARLYNLVGKAIAQWKIHYPKSRYNVDLPPGIYFLVLQKGRQIVIKRFLVE